MAFLRHVLIFGAILGARSDMQSVSKVVTSDGSIEDERQESIGSRRKVVTSDGRIEEDENIADVNSFEADGSESTSFIEQNRNDVAFDEDGNKIHRAMGLTKLQAVWRATGCPNTPMSNWSNWDYFMTLRTREGVFNTIFHWCNQTVTKDFPMVPMLTHHAQCCGHSHIESCNPTCTMQTKFPPTVGTSGTSGLLTTNSLQATWRATGCPNTPANGWSNWDYFKSLPSENAVWNGMFQWCSRTASMTHATSKTNREQCCGTLTEYCAPTCTTQISWASKAKWESCECELSMNYVGIPHSSNLAALNSQFSLEVSVTPTNDTYPRSLVPLYFGQNPTNSSKQGISIGHQESRNSIEVRMADGHSFGSQIFSFPSLPLNKMATFRVNCTKFPEGRECEVHVNGVVASAGENELAYTFPVTGDIYNMGGGLFGNVWGWKFTGTLHNITVRGCGFDEQACRSAAESAGLKLGNEEFQFVGDYSETGCFAWRDGDGTDVAFYGTRGGRQIAADSDLTQIMNCQVKTELRELQFRKCRLVGTYGCHLNAACTQSNANALASACMCGTNECAIGKFCYDDTCNVAAKADPCTSCRPPRATGQSSVVCITSASDGKCSTPDDEYWCRGRETGTERVTECTSEPGLPLGDLSCWSGGSDMASRDELCDGGLVCARNGWDGRKFGGCGPHHCCSAEWDTPKFNPHSFNPSSPLVSYVDRGSCGPRGDDATANPICLHGSKIVTEVKITVVPPNNTWAVAARISGCDYFAYTVYDCLEDPVDFNPHSINPSSPFVSYVDRGSCGPREDDAVANTSECVYGSRMVTEVKITGVPPDNIWAVAAKISGCDYFAYTVYECLEEPVDPNSGTREALLIMSSGPSEDEGEAAVRFGANAVPAKKASMDVTVENEEKSDDEALMRNTPVENEAM